MNKFSIWKSWKNRNEFPELKYPGVYSIAYSNEDISGEPFDWIKEIIYFGMTNSKGGLRQRLQQFENTIAGKKGHGGASRVIFKYKKYSELVGRLFVSIRVFNCNVCAMSVADLLTMGKVAEYEYICLAEYVSRFNCLPEFNDKKRSPKK